MEHKGKTAILKWKTCLQDALRNILRDIWNRKIRLAAGCGVSVLLFFLSWHYLFEGFNKRFLMFTALSLLTGIFMVLPKIKNRYLAIAAVICYLAAVPSKIFVRMEFPNYDLSRLSPGAQTANVIIILTVFCVFLLIFQRTGTAFAGGSIFLLCLTLINYYCIQFRGSSLTYLDLRATSAAISVLGNYRLIMSVELWYTILYFCLFISLGKWCDLPFKGKKYHIAVTAVSICGCLFFWWFWDRSGYLEKNDLYGHYWDATENEQLNGFLLSFGIGIKELRMEKPDGYSQAALEETAKLAEENYQGPVSGENRPNIIFIMNESWSDLRVLGNLETTQEYMPFVNSLTQSVVKGNTYVKILGGLTANSEFEALTGDTLAFLSPTAIPYELQVNHDMPSIATVLKEQGYQTMAMHPSGSAVWNREKVYGYFGFDDFIDQEKFQTPYLYLRGFLSDECNFNEIIWQFEHRDREKPFFLFDVSIQNHGGYYGDMDLPIAITKVGDVLADDAGYLYDAETYLNLMKVTDEAFENLIGYFEQVEEPVIVCMFGDHQPHLENDFYQAIFANSGLTEQEQTERKYITPYVIWANYETDFPEYGDLSANYLGAVLLECAGVKLSPYYKYLLELQRQCPVISYQTAEEQGQEKEILRYRMLQYNQLMEPDYIKDIFSVSP